MLWYSLEAPRRGASNEYHNIYFHGEIRQLSIFFREKKSALFGVTSKAANDNLRIRAVESG